MLLDGRARDESDDEDLDEDLYKLGIPERLVSSRSFQTTEGLASSLAPHTRLVPFALGKEE